jgi:salicylate hydroxylase
MSHLTQCLTTNKRISIIHRADYQRVLVEECERLGVDVRLKSEFDDVDFEQTTVTLKDGEVVSGDVIIGADGNNGPRQMLS